LKLVDTYVKDTTDINVVKEMVGPFLEAVLTDYNQNVDAARDAEVLNVISTIINKLQVKYYFFFFLKRGFGLVISDS
jgi:exportin-1